MVFTCLTYLSQKIHVTFKQFLSSVPITLCTQLCFTIVSSMAAAAVNALSDLPPDFFLHLLHICIPCFPYYNPGYYLKKNYFGVGTIKGKGLFKGGIIFLKYF